MPSNSEIKELFLNDVTYSSGTYTSEWLNSTSASRLNIIVYCSKSFTTVDLKIQGYFNNTSLYTRSVEDSVDGILPVDTRLNKTGSGALHTESYAPKRNYLFNLGTAGDLSTFVTPYSDIKGYDSGGSGLVSFNGGQIELYGLTVPERTHVYGSGYSYHPGMSSLARFSAKFYQGPKGGGTTGSTKQLIGMGNIDATNLMQDFVGFGYGDSTLPYDPDSFGVCYVRGGVSTFIPRTSWNRDTARGLTSTLNITDWNVLSMCQVEFSADGGDLNFYLEDREIGEYVKVHTFKFASTLTETAFVDPILGFFLCQSTDANSLPVSNTDMVSSGSFGEFSEGLPLSPLDRGSAFFIQTGVTTAQNILTLRCDTTFYGRKNFETMDIDIINGSSDGTKNAIVCLFKNMTIATPVWTAVDSNLFPASYDTAGTITPGSGQLLLAVSLSKNDSFLQTMNTLHLHLDPGDYITIVGESASASDISGGLGFHIG